MNFTIIKDKIKTDDFQKVRRTTTFMDYENGDIEKALKNSLFVVIIYHGLNPIAVSRIVGDGVVSFIIKDVIVIPEYKHQGIGKILMKEIFGFIKEHAVNNAYVGLMSTKGNEEFYEKFGFIRRPNEKYGSGMTMYYEKK